MLSIRVPLDDRHDYLIKGTFIMITKIRSFFWHLFSKYVRLAVFEFFVEIAIEETRKEVERDKALRRSRLCAKRCSKIH